MPLESLQVARLPTITIFQSEKSSQILDGSDDSIIEEESDLHDSSQANENDNQMENHTAEVQGKPSFKDKFKRFCDRIRRKKDPDPEIGNANQHGELAQNSDKSEKGYATSSSSDAVEEALGLWTWFRMHVKSFIYCVWFENGIMLCIVINTLCLAIDSPGLNKDVVAVLSKVNDVSHFMTIPTQNKLQSSNPTFVRFCLGSSQRNWS